MTAAQDLRLLSNEELYEKLDEAYEQLWSLRFQHSTRQLNDTSQFRKARREIARIKTVLREREIWEEHERRVQAAQADLEEAEV